MKFHLFYLFHFSIHLFLFPNKSATRNKSFWFAHLFSQVKQIATAELTEIELIIDRTIDTCLEKARIKPGVS